jgi:hypothetical protein
MAWSPLHVSRLNAFTKYYATNQSPKNDGSKSSGSTGVDVVAGGDGTHSQAVESDASTRESAESDRTHQRNHDESRQAQSRESYATEVSNTDSDGTTGTSPGIGTGGSSHTGASGSGRGSKEKGSESTEEVETTGEKKAKAARVGEIEEGARIGEDVDLGDGDEAEDGEVQRKASSQTRSEDHSKSARTTETKSEDSGCRGRPSPPNVRENIILDPDITMLNDRVIDIAKKFFPIQIDKPVPRLRGLPTTPKDLFIPDKNKKEWLAYRPVESRYFVCAECANRRFAPTVPELVEMKIKYDAVMFDSAPIDVEDVHLTIDHFRMAVRCYESGILDTLSKVCTITGDDAKVRGLVAPSEYVAPVYDPKVMTLQGTDTGVRPLVTDDFQPGMVNWNVSRSQRIFNDMQTKSEIQAHQARAAVSMAREVVQTKLSRPYDLFIALFFSVRLEKLARSPHVWALCDLMRVGKGEMPFRYVSNQNVVWNFMRFDGVNAQDPIVAHALVEGVFSLAAHHFTLEEEWLHLENTLLCARSTGFFLKLKERQDKYAEVVDYVSGSGIRVTEDYINTRGVYMYSYSRTMDDPKSNVFEDPDLPQYASWVTDSVRKLDGLTSNEVALFMTKARVLLTDALFHLGDVALPFAKRVLSKGVDIPFLVERFIRGEDHFKGRDLPFDIVPEDEELKMVLAAGISYVTDQALRGGFSMPSDLEKSVERALTTNSAGVPQLEVATDATIARSSKVRLTSYLNELPQLRARKSGIVPLVISCAIRLQRERGARLVMVVNNALLMMTGYFAFVVKGLGASTDMFPTSSSDGSVKVPNIIRGYASSPSFLFGASLDLSGADQSTNNKLDYYIARKITSALNIDLRRYYGFRSGQKTFRGPSTNRYYEDYIDAGALTLLGEFMSMDNWEAINFPSLIMQGGVSRADMPSGVNDTTARHGVRSAVLLHGMLICAHRGHRFSFLTEDENDVLSMLSQPSVDYFLHVAGDDILVMFKFADPTRVLPSRRRREIGDLYHSAAAKAMGTIGFKVTGSPSLHGGEMLQRQFFGSKNVWYSSRIGFTADERPKDAKTKFKSEIVKEICSLCDEGVVRASDREGFTSTVAGLAMSMFSERIVGDAQSSEGVASIRHQFRNVDEQMWFGPLSEIVGPCGLLPRLRLTCRETGKALDRVTYNARTGTLGMRRLIWLCSTDEQWDVIYTTASRKFASLGRNAKAMYLTVASLPKLVDMTIGQNRCVKQLRLAAMTNDTMIRPRAALKYLSDESKLMRATLISQLHRLDAKAIGHSASAEARLNAVGIRLSAQNVLARRHILQADDVMLKMQSPEEKAERIITGKTIDWINQASIKFDPELLTGLLVQIVTLARPSIESFATDYVLHSAFGGATYRDDFHPEVRLLNGTQVGPIFTRMDMLASRQYARGLRGGVDMQSLAAEMVLKGISDPVHRKWCYDAAGMSQRQAALVEQVFTNSTFTGQVTGVKDGLPPIAAYDFISSGSSRPSSRSGTRFSGGVEDILRDGIVSQLRVTFGGYASMSV